MSTHKLLSSRWARLFAAGAVAATLAGCATSEIGGPGYAYEDRVIGYEPGYEAHYSSGSSGYDYFPAHQVYYDRYRREYVYVENNAWVRRPQPHGLDVNLLFSTPSVHLQLRGTPERYHPRVVRSYPRHWRHSGYSRYDRHDRYDRYDRRGRYDHRYRRW